jgi:hypothetical protein
MNDAEIRRIAEKYARDSGLAIAQFQSMDWIDAEDGERKCVVRFEAQVPDDVASGMEFILVVVDESGNASAFETL